MKRVKVLVVGSATLTRDRLSQLLSELDALEVFACPAERALTEQSRLRSTDVGVDILLPKSSAFEKVTSLALARSEEP
jgi:PleD family two-component response regulator